MLSRCQKFGSQYQYPTPISIPQHKTIFFPNLGKKQCNNKKLWCKPDRKQLSVNVIVQRKLLQSKCSYTHTKARTQTHTQLNGNGYIVML